LGGKDGWNNGEQAGCIAYACQRQTDMRFKSEDLNQRLRGKTLRQRYNRLGDGGTVRVEDARNG